MDSLIKHIESNATKYNSNNKDLNVRIVKVGKEIDKIILTNYIINEKTKTINNGKFKKEVPKNHYGEITHKSDWEKYIEQMLSDDWEGDEEIFVPEDECSKPFNTPKILGCIDNLNNIIK